MSGTRPQFCELCGVLTIERGCYLPTDASYERVFVPGVLEFPLCPDCQRELKAGTPRAQCFINDLRALALAPPRVDA